ncbi:proto-oncogene tyrosine-protein kinase receptor Ret [Coccinella septempunctata]|uniref:proto-oncogene tyrosine-protein kinase receptor Ret n=1 Tax=Coccinella septempunctata TaxID=41139 RepID=UPI001D068AB5|nr:proto-oncogene tyrosine-protein kinase receptor Ret [Coccinella septempunctata]
MVCRDFNWSYFCGRTFCVRLFLGSIMLLFAVVVIVMGELWIGRDNKTAVVALHDATSKKIETLPLDASDCDFMLPDLCFWTSVEYRTKENRPRTVLGTLSNPNLVRKCPDYVLSYTMKRGQKRFTLLPPSKRGTPWQLQTSRPLDRDVPTSKEPISITCVIEDGKENRREIDKNITVDVLDVDDNLPIPQEAEYNVAMERNIVQKGHKIEHSIIFQDADSLAVNNYTFGVLHDTNHIFRPICDDFSRNDRIIETTIIHCKLEFVKDAHFQDQIYSVELKLVDESYEGNLSKEVKVPIHIHFNNMSASTPAALKRSSLRSLKLYPVQELRILRTAGPFARVAQPRSSLMNGTKDFKIKARKGMKSVFNITQTEGIVYVYDYVALRKAKEYIMLNITWTRNGIQEYDELEVRLVNEPKKNCENVSFWYFCSEFDNHEDCTTHTNCAVGTGGYNAVQNRDSVGYHRCEWRGDKNPSKFVKTPFYSTCTPDVMTCPDGFCDSLEYLNHSLCPQDCTESVGFPTERNPRTHRGIEVASGICICDSFGACHCGIGAKTKKKTTLHKVMDNSTTLNVTTGEFFGHVSKCGTFCVIGLVAAVFVVGSIVSFIVLCWRLSSVKKDVHKKFEDQEMMATLSEYTRTDGNDMNLPIQFDMVTSLIDQNIMNLLKKYEPDPKWEFPRTQLQIEKTLGEGEFGRVLRAKATDINGQSGITTVAVKTLKDDARESELNDLLSEYQLLKEVSHPNVIKLLGVCTTPGGPIYLIIEYAEHGALRNYLRRSRNIRISQISETSEQDQKTSHYDEPKTSQITSKELLSFAWQICNGMAYLSSVKLVHRDLAARNVLLATDKICKISDFGLTRDIYEDNAYTKRSKGRVPVKWMAPESLQDHVYTTKSDVWSFGILLWELVTLGASPYPGIAVQNLFHLLRQGYRMERPNNCSEKLYQIMRSCWEIKPENRPRFSDMAGVLEKMLGDGVDYMDLSDNVIQNKSYFFSPFDDLEDKPSNKLNYLKNNDSEEKCGETEKFLPHIVDTLEKKVVQNGYENTNNIHQGYESPVNIPRAVKTPSNEDPQYYTDMAKGSDSTK